MTYSIFTFFLFVLPLTQALPSLRDPISTLVAYSASYSTCAAAPNVYTSGGGPTAKVSVQPHCDNAISIICGTVVDVVAASSKLANFTATGHPPNTDAGACEAHIVFAESYDALGFDYATCVERFQSITVDCMLIGVGEWAFKGSQAGVRGVVYDPQAKNGSLANPRFSTENASSPGFLVGPPGYFGKISAVDLSEKVMGNSRTPRA